MTSKQGILEATFALLSQIEGTIEGKLIYHNGEMIDHEISSGAYYVMMFTDCVNDYIKRPGAIDTLLQRPRIFKPVKPETVRKYAAMSLESFAKVLFDLLTSKGTQTSPVPEKSPDFFERCLYAAYVYLLVAEFLDLQNKTFDLVPINKGMSALASINIGKQDIDPHTKQGKITVGDVVFEISSSGYNGKVSTAAIMLNDFFLGESYRTKSASIAIPLRELAAAKKRSTSKESLRKLREEVIEQMAELKPLGYRCKERIGGKWKESGKVDINGGTAFIANGVIYWNFNQDLFKQLSIYAPTDYPRELWSVDPRTNQFFFGRYIAQNRRLNEGKPGRDRIPIKTLISKSPNLPTYEEVMQGNRHVKSRIIEKTFSDLDALENLFYTVCTADGQRVDDPANMDYQTFIEACIVVDYSDYPQHPERATQRQQRQKKINAAIEKKEIEAAAKAKAAKAKAAKDNE